MATDAEPVLNDSKKDTTVYCITCSTVAVGQDEEGRATCGIYESCPTLVKEFPTFPHHRDE